MKNNKLIVSVVVSLLIGGGAGFFAGSSSDAKSEKVASVNGDAITKEDLYEAMEQQIGSQVIDNLISNKLIEQEVEKEKIAASDEEIEKELSAIKAQYGGDDQFKNALSTNGLSVEEFKKDLSMTVKLKKMLSKNIKITDEEMKKYFEENKETYAQSEQVRASHILVYDKKEAEELLKKAKAGDDFTELAKKNSKDEGSAQNGGDLSFFGKGQMEPAFEKAAFELKKNEISDIVSYDAPDPATGETKTRYHIIKVTDKKEAKEANFDDSKEAIKETLLNQKMQTEYQTWLEKAKNESKIENKLAKK